MSLDLIIQEQIEITVCGVYLNWQIGLTTDPGTRRAHLGNPLDWLQWQVDSDDMAWNIVQYFVKRGMRFAGGNRSATKKYVYLSLS